MRKLPWKGEARGWGKEVGDIGGWGVSGGHGGDAGRAFREVFASGDLSITA